MLHVPEPGSDYDGSGNSELGDMLLELVGWKYISPQLAQKIACGAMIAIRKVIRAIDEQDEQGAETLASELCPDLSVLSKLGANGAYPNNVSRDLLQAYVVSSGSLLCQRIRDFFM